MIDRSISFDNLAVKAESHQKGEPLGIIANKVSPSLNNEVSPEDLNPRILRFMWQSAARQLLPRERVAECMRKMIPGAETVDIVYSETAKRAKYRNLVVCSRIWQCPVCAARISEERRKTLSGQLDRLPHFPIMNTYTIRHSREDNLKDLLKLISKAKKKFRQGKLWQQLEAKYGLSAAIRALEVTYGENGWHVHIHELQLLQSNLGAGIVDLTHELKTRWTRIVGTLGGNADYEHGFDVSTDRENVTDYVAKIGKDVFLTSKWRLEHEITKSVTKLAKNGGRTPNQLLHDYCFYSDLRAGMLWKEYSTTFKGRRQLVPASFAALLGEEELPDEVIAADYDPNDSLLAMLSWQQWQPIWKDRDLRGQLLIVASENDPHLLADFLKGCGVEL